MHDNQSNEYYIPEFLKTDYPITFFEKIFNIMDYDIPIESDYFDFGYTDHDILVALRIVYLSYSNGDKNFYKENFSRPWNITIDEAVSHFIDMTRLSVDKEYDDESDGIKEGYFKGLIIMATRAFLDSISLGVLFSTLFEEYSESIGIYAIEEMICDKLSDKGITEIKLDKYLEVSVLQMISEIVFEDERTFNYYIDIIVNRIIKEDKPITIHEMNCLLEPQN